MTHAPRHRRADLTLRSPAPQPYSYVQGFPDSADTAYWSPDPLAHVHWPAPSASDDLEVFVLIPVAVEADTPDTASDLQSLCAESSRATVSGPGTIAVDFGVECAGWLEFDSPDYPGGVQLSISEYNQPGIVNVGAEHPEKTNVPEHISGDTYRLVLNQELFEGVRFAWIHVCECAKPWHITGLRLMCQTKPVNYNGSFRSNDTVLNEIWSTAAYSVRVGLFRDYFGAILMDRSDRFSWTGDAYTAQAGALVAFGNYDFIRKNLDNTSTQSNGIASYPLYFVLSLVDLLWYTGDREILEVYRRRAHEILSVAAAQFMSNPNQCFYGSDERLGAMFENASCSEAQRTFNFLCVRVHIEFAEVLEAFGMVTEALVYRTHASEGLERVRQDSRWIDGLGLFSAAEAVNTGLLTSAEKNTIRDRYFSDRMKRIAYSAFSHYHILQAMARLEMFDEALLSVRDLWGGQIAYGGTTSFECYHPSWNDDLEANDPVPNGQTGYTSLCHPWGAGVVKWLHEWIAGVRPTRPGFSEFETRPNLGSSLSTLAIEVPTPHGVIRVSIDTENRVADLTVPEGTRATCVDTGTVTWSSSHAPEHRDTGDHRFSIHCPEKQKYVEPDIEYDAQVVSLDRDTQGNWGGSYGSDGYVLFGANHGHDVQILPPYVHGVRVSRSADNLATFFSTEARVLAQSRSNEAERIFGGLRTRNPEPTKQTFTVDVYLREPRTFELSVYCVDWDREGLQQAFELHNADNGEMIAPVRILRDFGNGVYLTYRYHDSVRIRVNHVRGTNAVLNGVFFDSMK